MLYAQRDGDGFPLPVVRRVHVGQTLGQEIASANYHFPTTSSLLKQRYLAIDPRQGDSTVQIMNVN